MTTIFTDRLLRLATALDISLGDDDFVFDLKSWGEGETRRTFPLFGKKYTCMTQGCAIGLACTLPEFNREGFSWMFNSGDKGVILPVLAGTAWGWSAVDQFFGLTEDQAHYLFHEESYEGLPHHGPEAAMAVADRIRAFVDEPDVAQLAIGFRKIDRAFEGDEVVNEEVNSAVEETREALHKVVQKETANG